MKHSFTPWYFHSTVLNTIHLHRHSKPIPHTKTQANTDPWSKNSVWHQRCDCHQQVSKYLMKCKHPHSNLHIIPVLLFNPQALLTSECSTYFTHWVNLLSVFPTIILAMWGLHSNLFHNCQFLNAKYSIWHQYALQHLLDEWITLFKWL